MITSLAAAVAKSGGMIRNDGNEEGIKATATGLLGPVGLCFDSNAQMPQVGTRIRRVKHDGTINLVAGDGTNVLNDPASDESILYPFLMAVDRDGRLIVADSALDQIKMLKPGTISK
jgi:hypothetical protein